MGTRHSTKYATEFPPEQPNETRQESPAQDTAEQAPEEAKVPVCMHCGQHFAAGFLCAHERKCAVRKRDGNIQRSAR